MTDIYRVGKADAVAQVAAASIDSVDATPANNTFTVTIGGIAISQVGTVDEATTAAALVALLNGSTHPYFAAITWTNPSAGNIVGTADVAGVPFVAALTETGAGSGSVTDFSDTTASSGPNHWDTAANWSTNSNPTGSDSVWISDLNEAILWGLDQNAVTLAELYIDLSMLQPVGLNRAVFQEDVSDTDLTKPDYREDYLKISATLLVIGGGQGNAATATGRIKIDTGSNASACVVENSKPQASETNKRPVRLLFGHSSSTLMVRGGNVGVAVDAPTEAATLGSARLLGGTLDIGQGTTLTNWYQTAGTGHLNCGATLVEVDGGDLAIAGAGSYTTLTQRGGAIAHNATGTVGTATVGKGATLTYTRGGTITTMNLAGKLDLSARTEALTVSTFNVTADGAEIYDPNGVLADDTTFVPAAGVNLANCKINISAGEKLKKVA